MAKNLVYRNTDSKNRVQDLGVTLAPGAHVISKDGKPAVTVTASADYVRSEAIPGVGTLSGIPAGGVGLVAQEVTLAFDGTWEFPTANISGVTASTANGTLVYRTSGGALTATSTSNTLFGSIDVPPGYDRTRGFTPIKIGA